MTPLQHAFRFLFSIMSASDTDMARKTKLMSVFMSKFSALIDFDLSSELNTLSQMNEESLLHAQQDSMLQLKQCAMNDLCQGTIEIAVQIGSLDGALRDDEYIPITHAAREWGIDIDSLLKKK